MSKMEGNQVTNEQQQQRKMLEAAAKACRIEISTWSNCQAGGFVKGGKGKFWNPLTSPADCAEMCAELLIDWLNSWESVVAKQSQEVWVRASIKDHDNSRLKAWMAAATMVAAKIGDLK
jgi:hypothetical protein